MRGILNRNRGRKTSLRWSGPYRVIECRSNYNFLIEDLLSEATGEVHGTRLKFFRNSSYEVTEELLNQIAYQRNELLVIERFCDIRDNDGEIEILVKWRGFLAEENDWTTVATLREDVPELLDNYLKALRATRSSHRV